MERAGIIVVSVVAAACLWGCRKTPAGPVPEQTSPAAWGVELVKVVAGMDVPECALYDHERRQVYVSNISTSNKGYWVEDGKGFLSVLSPEGVTKKLRWVDSTDAMPIHAPKGLGILDGYLYFADVTALKRVAISGGEVETIALPEAKRLNDVAADGEAIWVSDVELSKIYRVDMEGKVREIPAPEHVNGVTCHDGKMYAVSWFHHDVYEVDPAGEKEPVAFGLADHFTNLDGIEVLDDGTFLVSDFTGGKVCTIAADRRTVNTLVELETPADIGLDRANGLLYVPQLKLDKVVIFRLRKE
ncbi:MAG: hypothetical protein IH624_02125 [Phycisphaerae bacterium]|nr:hypothetical protein [Phycisphaerae bacterium]